MTGRSRGQSLVELALCAPILALLALGGAAAVQVADAKAGLDAATQAAAAAAARAPDPVTAESDARQRFESIVTAYAIRAPVINVTVGAFSRTDEVVASAAASVDITWAAFFLPGRIALRSTVLVNLEPWRTHRASP